MTTICLGILENPNKVPLNYYRPALSLPTRYSKSSPNTLMAGARPIYMRKGSNSAKYGDFFGRQRLNGRPLSNVFYDLKICVRLSIEKNIVLL